MKTFRVGLRELDLNQEIDRSLFLQWMVRYLNQDHLSDLTYMQNKILFWGYTYDSSQEWTATNREELFEIILAKFLVYMYTDQNQGIKKSIVKDIVTYEHQESLC